MNKHTLGPWIMYPLKGNDWGINGFHKVDGFHNAQDCMLASVYSVEANARLIAAAPDLLEACMTAMPAVIALLDRLKKEDMQTAQIAAETTRNMLQSAITKATL